MVPGCLLHMLPFLSPQLDLGLGPGFPGPWCRPSGALLQVVGSLLGGFYLRSRRPGRRAVAPGCSVRSPEEYQVSRPYLVAVV